MGNQHDGITQCDSEQGHKTDERSKRQVASCDPCGDDAANKCERKVCQNEQTDDWAQLWSFHLRVCDSLGGAVPVTNVTEKVK